MRSTTHRSLCGVLGGFLIVLVSAGVTLLSVGILATPARMLQAGLLATAGVLDVVAAVDTPLTDRVDWYRLSGAANVALGLALPVGLLDWGTDTGGTVFVAVSAVGGLALAAIGVDICLYAGAHIYERPLDVPAERAAE
ncbi:MAG: hypothetical protein ABEJ73_05245 [Haloplanus sp.]